MSQTVGWIAIAIMVCAIAACTYGIDRTRQELDHEMRAACFERGGNWESGWWGMWCKPMSAP